MIKLQEHTQKEKDIEEGGQQLEVSEVKVDEPKGEDESLLKVGDV